MTPTPDKADTQQAIDAEAQIEVSRQLMRDGDMFGFCIWRTNEDGTWTRIAPEDVLFREQEAV